MRFSPAPPPPLLAPLWARGPHAQTILAHLLPAPWPALVPGQDGVTIHEVPLPDGDRLCVLHRPGTSGTRVVVFHGLSGDSSSDYVRLAAAVASARGHSVLAVNHRGCGPGAGLARGMYHSGRGDDCGEVLAWARRELPPARHLAVGFSLSGNALLHLLSGGGPEDHWPDGAITINPPIDLRACSLALMRGANRLYELRFVRRCTRTMERRAADGLLPEGFRVPRVRTLWEFDERVTAPLSGFADAEDYYRRCSTRDRLERIERPTAVLHAADDPFVPVTAFESLRLPPAVHLHVEPRGGHVGYLTSEGLRLRPRPWLLHALDHFLAALESA
jgi:predicted alpha/beta-fold hydrolase